jgi:hypothetical protein
VSIFLFLLVLLINEPRILHLLPFLFTVVEAVNTMAHALWTLNFFIPWGKLLLIHLLWNILRVSLHHLEILFLLEMVVVTPSILTYCSRKLLKLFNKRVFWIAMARAWTWGSRCFLLCYEPVEALEIFIWSLVHTSSIARVDFPRMTNFHGTWAKLGILLYLLSMIGPSLLLLLSLIAKLSIVVWGFDTLPYHSVSIVLTA